MLDNFGERCSKDFFYRQISELNGQRLYILKVSREICGKVNIEKMHVIKMANLSLCLIN
jgi:hypothetical protein